MRIITITSDWQENSFYLGVLKGFLLKNCPQAKIIDLNHKIAFKSISQAAFVIRNSYTHFPENTIHIIAVKTETDKNTKPVIVKADNQYFISSDNGVFSLIFDQPLQKKIEIPTSKTSTFPELDFFAPAACLLNKGVDLSSIGEEKTKLKRSLSMLAYTDNNQIEGKIIYIDNYKNAITNITKEIFEQIGKGQEFQIIFKSAKYKITKISSNYSEEEYAEIIAIFNSFGYLELAQTQGQLAEIMQLSINDRVLVKFKNPNKKIKTVFD